jgi:hypothetical protein
MDGPDPPGIDNGPLGGSSSHLRRLKQQQGPDGGRCQPGAAIAADGSCACSAGWWGPTSRCAVCTDDSVCPGLTGQSDSKCDTNLTYSAATRYKPLACDLVGGLSKWVSRVAAICNVRGERLPFADGPLGLEVSV